MSILSENRRSITPIVVILFLCGLSFVCIVQVSHTTYVAFSVATTARNSAIHIGSAEPLVSKQKRLTMSPTIVATADDQTSGVTNDKVAEDKVVLPVTDGDNNSEISSNNEVENIIIEPSPQPIMLGGTSLADRENSEDSVVAPTPVISWEGVSGMQSIASRYWEGNLFCETIDQTRSTAGDPNLPIIANLTFSCGELYEKSELGTGNFIALFYGIRLAAYVYGNIDLYITCDDANDTKTDLILPWITGRFPARPLIQNSSIPISVKEACGSYVTQPLAYMYNEIQHDLRKMAVELMGVPSADHASATFAESNLWSGNQVDSSPTGGMLTLHNPRRDDTPPFPSSEYSIDDAVLHFRCGDLMNSKHPSFAFMKFSGYTRHISPEAKTIGIVTQPFDADTQSRKADSGQHTRNRCRAVVYSLVEYIKDHYPNAEVRIHNSIGETIALTFARMIMANQTIAGISSFGVIPAVATFGTGYIRQPDYPKAPNQWLIHPRIDELTDNVVVFDEAKIIMVGQMKRLWKSEGESGVLNWFRNDTAR